MSSFMVTVEHEAHGSGIRRLSWHYTRHKSWREYLNTKEKNIV